MKTNPNNSKASEETKQVQVKFIKEASIFDQIDVESLALFHFSTCHFPFFGQLPLFIFFINIRKIPPLHNPHKW